MSYLLDTDICSAYLKNDPVVVQRVMLHCGGLNVSVITVGELLTWAMRTNAPLARLKGVQDMLKGATVLDVNQIIAEKFGEVRAGLLDHGITVGEMDLLNRATALVHGLTVTTHNVQDYVKIPGLKGCTRRPAIRARRVLCEHRGTARVAGLVLTEHATSCPGGFSYTL